MLGIHLFKKEDRKTFTKEDKYIYEEMRAVREQMENAYALFNLTDDHDLTDVYIHEINSLTARYDYLIKRAKKSGITLEHTIT